MLPINDINTLDSTGLNPLHRAIDASDLAKVEELLKHGANANEMTFSGHSPLHLAAASYKEHAPEIIKYLLAHGADANALNDNDITPLEMAIRQRNAKAIVALAIATANADGKYTFQHVRNFSGETAFELAIKAGQIEHLHAQIDLCADFNANDALRASIRSKQSEIIKFLLMSGHGSIHELIETCAKNDIQLDHERQSLYRTAITVEALARRMHIVHLQSHLKNKTTSDYSC